MTTRVATWWGSGDAVDPGPAVPAVASPGEREALGDSVGRTTGTSDATAVPPASTGPSRTTRPAATRASPAATTMAGATLSPIHVPIRFIGGRARSSVGVSGSWAGHHVHRRAHPTSRTRRRPRPRRTGTLEPMSSKRIVVAGLLAGFVTIVVVAIALAAFGPDVAIPAASGGPSITPAASGPAASGGASEPAPSSGASSPTASGSA